MSDTPNPEHINWYEKLVPVEHALGFNLSLYTDGYIRMDTMRFDYDLIVEGGVASLGEVDTISFYSISLSRAIRTRLGLSETSFEPESRRWMNCNRQMQIEFQGIPTDDEAMFFIALSMATPEKPVEKVLREIREWGGAVLALNNQPDTELAANGSEDIKAKEDLEIKPGSFAEFCKQLKTHNIEPDKHALKELYRSGHTRTIVRQFARYKQLQEALRSRSSGNPEGAIRELIEIENGLDQDLVVANRVIRNTRFNIQLVTPVTDPKDERYHRNYPYVPSSKPINRMSPAEKSQLVLVVLPEGYESKRQTTIAEEFLRASSDWLN